MGGVAQEETPCLQQDPWVPLLCPTIYGVKESKIRFLGDACPGMCRHPLLWSELEVALGHIPSHPIPLRPTPSPGAMGTRHHPDSWHHFVPARELAEGPEGGGGTSLESHPPLLLPRRQQLGPRH